MDVLFWQTAGTVYQEREGFIGAGGASKNPLPVPGVNAGSKPSMSNDI